MIDAGRFILIDVLTVLKKAHDSLAGRREVRIGRKLYQKRANRIGGDRSILDTYRIGLVRTIISFSVALLVQLARRQDSWPVFFGLNYDFVGAKL